MPRISKVTTPPTPNLPVIGHIDWCDVDKGTTWSELLDPELQSHIPGYWLEFPPASYCMSMFLAWVYIAIIVVGVTGNLVVINIFRGNKHLRTPSNYLILNLAISDMIMVFKGVVFIHNSFFCGPDLSLAACEFYGFSTSITGCCSLLTIMAMSIDRYRVISNPLNPVRLTTCGSITIILFIWLFSIFCSLFPYLKIANRYVMEGYLTACTFDFFSEDINSKVFFALFFLFVYCLPLILIFSSYIGIYGAVKRNSKQFKKFEEKTVSTVSDATGGSGGGGGGEDPKSKSKKERARQKQEVKIAKVAFGLVGLWMAAFTPYAIVCLGTCFYDHELFSPKIVMIPSIIIKLSATINPWVYGMSHPAFKKAFKEYVFNVKSSAAAAPKPDGSRKSVQAAAVENISLDTA